jgi:hypothetical protein
VKEESFRLLDASPSGAPNLKDERTALFLDPDKGVRRKKSKEHVTVQIIASHVEKHPVVFSYDQSFSRSSKPYEEMIEKLSMLKDTGNIDSTMILMQDSCLYPTPFKKSVESGIDYSHRVYLKIG